MLQLFLVAGTTPLVYVPQVMTASLCHAYLSEVIPPNENDIDGAVDTVCSDSIAPKGVT